MTKLDELCVNTLRFLSVDAVEKAKSGHPGAPMGAAPTAYVIWTRFLRHNPLNPLWPDRDRFILSMGHASMLLYSLLHLTGYDMSIEELRSFRQWGSHTPGHPEYDPHRGVETTTGPLGQGFGNAVGMAIAEAFLAARYNRPGHKIVDHYTYVMASDGDLMEGVSAEAASLAGHLGLGKLIVLYDSNRITIEGSTDIAFSEDVAKRFEAYGWQVLRVKDGNDVDDIAEAIQIARKDLSRPSLIIVPTHIGYGSPKQDSAAAHGAPLGPEAVEAAKGNLGWPLEPSFYIPDEALKRFRQAVTEGERMESDWSERFETWRREYPDLAKEWEMGQDWELPEGWEEKVPTFPTEKEIATRNASGEVLNAIASHIPYLIGGSADLAPSTKTYLKEFTDFQKGNHEGRNLRFGVREHAMGAILNGMMLHRGVLAYGGTFLVFSDYMRPPIRLAAMMGIPVRYIFTHDSIGVGEDGPTHQPVEQLPALRAIPNLVVIRPADANETAQAWIAALKRKDGPTALILTRQSLPVLDPDRYPIREGVKRGAYVLSESSGGKPDLILIGTGSEVHLALKAQEKLASEGIKARVVSMPSWELFEMQEPEYRRYVLPPDMPRLAIEAAVPLGWHRWVGDRGDVIGLNRFGVSAPGKVALEKLGFNVDNVLAHARKLVR
ncbi:transketolase [Candidatus Poribacteria bacterium]|nr:transketolase [Candidatus Poribacteria bacterium]